MDCGENKLEHTKNDTYQSNYWYNDGLTKSEVHDLSGALESLEKSLEYNEQNIDARNLLGLVYYAEGEIAEALKQWNISKEIKSSDNLACEYIKKIEETPSEREMMNTAVKKYNQCLSYCKQGGEDLALIQLKKIVSSHPSFLKAQQLLTLLYIQTEQYSKARTTLRHALKIDTTNEISLHYQQILKEIHEQTVGGKQKENNQKMPYKIGNESFLRPVIEIMRDNSPKATIINIIVGIIVGAAAIWFLVMPAVNQAQADKLNKEVVKYSDQIATKNAEVSALKKELGGYKKASAEVETVKKNAEETRASYDALFEIYKTTRKGYNKEEVALQLQAINKDALSDDGKKVYDEIYTQVVLPLCEKKYRTAQRSFKSHNYEETISAIEFIISYDERYEGGNALMMLAQSYQAVGKIEEAKTVYKKAEKLFPDTEVARDAGIALHGVTGEGPGENIENDTEE